MEVELNASFGRCGTETPTTATTVSASCCETPSELGAASEAARPSRRYGDLLDLEQLVPSLGELRQRLDAVARAERSGRNPRALDAVQAAGKSQRVRRRGGASRRGAGAVKPGEASSQTAAAAASFSATAQPEPQQHPPLAAPTHQAMAGRHAPTQQPQQQPSPMPQTQRRRRPDGAGQACRAAKGTRTVTGGSLGSSRALPRSGNECTAAGPRAAQAADPPGVPASSSRRCGQSKGSVAGAAAASPCPVGAQVLVADRKRGCWTRGVITVMEGGGAHVKLLLNGVQKCPVQWFPLDQIVWSPPHAPATMLWPEPAAVGGRTVAGPAATAMLWFAAGWQGFESAPSPFSFAADAAAAATEAAAATVAAAPAATANAAAMEPLKVPLPRWAHEVADGCTRS